MPYPLLPGRTQLQPRSHSMSYIAGAVIIVLGSAAYLLSPVASERRAAPVPTITTQPAQPTTPTAAMLDARQDDLVLHLHQTEDAITRAVQRIESSQRLTTAAARTLENSGLPVQARRVQAAFEANTIALDYLRNALEQLDVLSQNSITHKEN
jgi:hypothetical protein